MAIASCDSYASFVLSNPPRASMTPWLHAARLPFLKQLQKETVCLFPSCSLLRETIVKVLLENQGISKQNNTQSAQSTQFSVCSLHGLRFYMTAIVHTTLSVMYIILCRLYVLFCRLCTLLCRLYAYSIGYVHYTLSVVLTTLSVIYITLSVVRTTLLVVYITLSVVRTTLSVLNI